MGNISSETIAIALSGGIDSLVVLGMLKNSFPEKKIEAISVKFADSVDETKTAAAIANKFDINHNIIYLENYLEELPKAISIVGLPFWDLHWFYVAKKANSFSNFILTGDGGDEIFGGYTFRYQKFLSIINSKSSSLEKVKAYLSCHERDWVPDQDELFGPSTKFDWNKIYEKFLPFFENSLSPLEQVFLADYNGKLCYNFSIVSKSINDNFKLTSITPLLSKEIIYYGTHLSWKYKYDPTNNIGKIPLRKILSKLNLENFVNQNKQGFSVSTTNMWNSFAQKTCKDFLLDSNLVKDKWINANWINRYINNSDLNVRYVNKFLGLLAFEIWYRLFVTRDMNQNTKL